MKAIQIKLLPRAASVSVFPRTLPTMTQRSKTAVRLGILCCSLVLLTGLLPQARGADTFLKGLTNGAIVRSVDTVAVKDGSVFVLGTYSNATGTADSDLKIGNTTLPRGWQNEEAGFLAKLGPDGGWRWAIRLYGSSSGIRGKGSGVKGLTATDNHVYIIGAARQSIILEDTAGQTKTTTASGTASNSAPYVLKLDLNGKFVWGKMVQQYGNLPLYDPTVNDIAVDGADNVYICGQLPYQNPPNQATVFAGITTPAFPGFGAYVAKLNSSGIWQWVMGYYGNTFGNEFFGLAVDDSDRIIVTGWTDGDKEDVIYEGSGASYASTFEPFGTKTVTIIRLNKDGSVGPRRYFTVGGGTLESAGRSVAFIGGKVYVGAIANGTLSYYDPGNYTPPPRPTLPSARGGWDAYLFRMAISDTAVDVEKVTQIGGTGFEDIGRHLSSDSSGNIYISGRFSDPQASFGTNSFASRPDGAQTGPDVTTSKTNLFVGKLNRDLDWQWVQRAEGSPPDIMDAPNATVAASLGRVYLFGSAAGGTVRLGPSATQQEITTSTSQYAAFLSALEPSGVFLQEVTLNLLSDFGGTAVRPAIGTQTYLRGETITASVPPLIYLDAQGNSVDPGNDPAVRELGVTRYTCTGFEVLDTVNSGNSSSYSFVINRDTQLRFNWQTEYALDVKNDISGSQGGLTSTAAGNPDPVVQKHWIEEGTITTAFIDGAIPSPNANEYGTRYRSTGYYGAGAAAPAGNALDITNGLINLGARPEYQPGSGPWTIEFWMRSDAVDIYSRRIINWDGLFYFSQENAAGIQYNFASTNFFTGSVKLTGVPVRQGEWHHFAFVKDNTAWTIYYDGEVVATKSVTGTVGATTNPLLLGQYFDGAIDEFRLWRVARTQTEIQSYMQNPLPNPADSSLYGYWSFDTSTNGSVSDLRNPAITLALSTNAMLSTGIMRDRVGNFFPWASVQSRQQVPQFIMSSPATIEYRWVKENRIQVSTAPSALANAPSVVSGGVTNTGTGEFWFTNNASLVIRAPEKPATPAGYQLKGFTGGLGNVATVTGDGDGKGTGTRSYIITNFTQGSAIVWDYSDRIYKGNVVIGQAINFAPGGTFTGTEAIPDSEMLNPSNAPLATTIVSGSPAGSSIDDMRVWDDVADKLYPLRPGVILLEWGRLPGATDTRNILAEITVTFPTNASFTHIANTPPVPLDDNKTNSVTFVALKYSERSTTLVSDAAEFSVPDTGFSDPFRSVLLFSERPDGSPANGDLTRERLLVRTVLTKKWDAGLQLTTATIGTPITSGFHASTVPHNGYVYFEKARYNAGIYNRTSRQGPIIAVNQFPGAKLDENLVVVWYQTLEGIHWPYQAVQYNPAWPNTANRIVIASRLGSEGVDASGNPQLSFSASRYSQVQIYNQPDKTKAGYNPNEEHALIAPSLVNVAVPTPAAFALRNNLNVTNQDATYTSDPFVLVQYFDQQTTNFGMAAYRVEVQDVNTPARRLEFTAGTGSGQYALGTGGVVEFNYTTYAQLTGLRTNEPVDLEVNDNLLDANSGRYYLTRVNDNKFTLSATVGGAALTASAITPGEYPSVIVTRAFPYTFEYQMRAGEPVLAPYPLQQVIGASTCALTRGENLDPNQLVYWEDHKKQPWAVSGSTNPAAGTRAQFYYPLQPAFWHPTAALGDCLPYVSNSVPIWVTNHTTWPLRVPVLKAGETLTYSGGEINRDDANKPGVPGVVGWAAGKVVYDDANSAMDYTKTVTNYLARFASPLLTLEAPLPVAQVPSELQPASGNVTVNGTAWTFKKLDASLQPRVFYDQIKQKLSVRGYLDGKTLGDPTLTAAPGSIYVLQPNILTAADSNALMTLSSLAAWNSAVSNLVRVSRDPQNVSANLGGAQVYGVGLEVARGTNGAVLSNQARPAVQFGPGLALLPNQGLLDPNAGLREGYVTLAENDDDLLGDAPVILRIIRIQKQPLFRGAIKTINPPNPFDEKITLRHSGDFGANAGDLVFEWYYRPDDGAVVAPPDQTNVWSIFTTPNGGRGAQEINLAGAGETTLSDNRFFARWRHFNNTNANAWSQWAGAANSRPPATNELAQNTYVPQLAEGWVKRVIAGVNPFDARVTDFRNNNTPATYASMVQQAGAPYRGPVALNANKNVIENTGLIELYTTVIQRAKSLSIDLSSPISTPAVNNAILLAASRIADLQLLLGNEAYTDAQDPTIGFGSSSVEYGALAPTIFCFQNQMASLMDEELALLRGRGEEGAYPAYNRLLWNFTRAEGEAAYALSYRISDVNADGFINEADARIMYPQGHGDAWGQYLSALRTYYDLLRHPNYNWQSRSENLQIEGVVVAVDYLDERKFAQAAAAKAKAGSEIVNLTYRSRYVEDPDGQWQGYQDTDATRAWGVSDWARRAGCAALYDWVTANAILPSSDTNHTGIEKVDRSTVKELSQISAQALEIRKQLDNANTGLNPIGLATDVVPFDIDPIGFDSSTGQRSMHFDQVYERALKSMGNAMDVFNYANQLNNMLRQVASTSEQFAQDAAAADLDFRNRLIEVFGTPYTGTIGPGKAYPAGYTGPDIYLYMYTDVTGIQNVPPPSAEFTAYFGKMDGGFVNTGAPGGGGDSIATVWSSYFPGDAPNISDNTNTDFTTKLALNLPQTASGYAFQAPAGWGSRRAPGEIQQVLSEMVQAEADLQLALHDYDGVVGDIKDMTLLIQAQSGMQADTIKIQEEGRNRTIGLNTAIFTAQSVSAMGALGAEMVNDTAETVSSALPTVVGLASDAFSALRGATIATGRIAKQQLQSLALVSDRTAAFLEGTKEVAQIQQDIAIQKADFKYAMQEQLKEFESLLGDEAAKRIEVFRRQEALRQISDKYRGVLEAGLRLLEERELHNKRSAGATQQNRYQDFTFRVARNDALSKYRAAFDLAARYVYLAAKAYDYETNLDPNDPASARPTLTQIIRARTLGAMDNGVPRLGSGGLADALATLKVNFDVLKTQMGFNNPQTESGRFSLRNELFRIAPGPMLNGQRDTSTNRVSYAGATMTAAAAWDASDTKWRDALQNTSGGGYTAKVIPDLWQVPEFRRYCRPFAPESAGAQPGLVITFGSQIVFGKNFFGWPLSGGDSAYDPSHFATKVRSVGLWFENYNGEGLSVTPRAYLVPAGLDIMMVPSSADLATREWNVVDQKIPVPLPVSQSALRDPSWIPLKDSLNGTIAEIRRYSMFRAYHDAGFTTDEMTSDSRLVGRSVWNTRWMIIIPGGTFLASGQEGLDTFIKGRTVPGGTARDGNGVKDIKLFFQTYAYSGN